MANTFKLKQSKCGSDHSRNLYCSCRNNNCCDWYHTCKSSGSGVNVGVGITRAGTTEDVKLLKNAPIPQGSSLEFMGGNKVVLESTDTVTVDSDTNNSVDASLTIMEIT